MKYLITGRAGSGKSAVNTELQRRGLPSLDSDNVPNLASWRDLITNEQVKVDPGGFVDYSKVGWNWDSEVLRELLSQNGELFLCGSASNELDFHQLFDRVFVLTLDSKTQRQRLVDRNNNYGKNPKMQDLIIKEQQEFTAQALKLGATPVDSTQPLERVVDEILRCIKHEN